MAGESAIVILDGRAFDGWKKVEITQTFDKATGEGSLTISPQPGNPLPADVGSTVQIILAGKPVLTGYVSETSGQHGWGDHDIELTLRDKTTDLVESTVGPGLEMKPPIAFKDVASKTLKHMGLSDIKVIDKVGPPPFRQGGEVPVAAIDEFGHGWLDRWARMRQVVMNTDGEGNLVIDRNQKRRGPGHLTKLFEDSPVNNVLKASYKNSEKGRHNEKKCSAQKSTNDKDYWESRPKSDPPAQSNPLATKTGVGTDSAVRPTRKYHYRARGAIEGQTPEQSAKWMANLARSRNYTYNATVQGFLMAPGQLWWPGFIIPVIDMHFLIEDELFIKEVKFCKEYAGGSTTEVHCTTNDAYTEGDDAPKSRTAKRGMGVKKPGSY